jgi:GH25 family lysozyme M1 (1,4-beta-N-acetylmuramidase)
MAYVKGIDVSSWQDNGTTPQRIDWTKPAAHGVKFVINRVAFAATKDDDFDYNWNAQRGLYQRGGYGFWGYWPGAPDVAVQARAVVNILRPDPGEFPVVYADVEKASSSYPDLPIRTIALPSLERYMKGIEDGLGIGTGIYTNIAGLLKLSPIPAWLLAKPLWIAWPLSPSTGETVEAFIERTKIRPPLKEWTDFKFWQFSWTGPGKQMGMESSGLDMDYFNGTEQDLINYCGGTVTPPPPATGGTMWQDNPLGVVVDGTMNVDFAALKAAGYSFVVIEIGAGFQVNPALAEQCDKAHKAGLPALFQYTPDPAVVNYTTLGLHQAQMELVHKAIASKKFYGFVVSVERNKTGESGVPATDMNINDIAKMLCETMTNEFEPRSIPVFVRTNDNFVQSYCKPLANWSDKFGFFLADWRYRTRDTNGEWKQYTSYPAVATPVANIAALRAACPPDNSKNPPVPGSTPQMKFWEFSGNRFMLPEVKGWDGSQKRVKVVLFHGDENGLRTLLGVTVTPPPPSEDDDPTTDLDLEQRVEAAEQRVTALETALAQLRGEYQTHAATSTAHNHTHGGPQ